MQHRGSARGLLRPGGNADASAPLEGQAVHAATAKVTRSGAVCVALVCGIWMPPMLAMSQPARDTAPQGDVNARTCQDGQRRIDTTLSSLFTSGQ